MNHQEKAALAGHGEQCSASTGKRSSRPTLTPADWIRAAADVLVNKGVDSIKVDALAKVLGVTKGSFYWHFTDRDDLLEQVLLGWRLEQTELQIKRYRQQGKQAEALVQELAELPFRGRAAARGASVELAIRAWARRDERARRVVDEVDSARLDYLDTVFRSLGCDAREARPRAFLLYSYMQSEAIFRNQGTDEEKRERRQFVVRLLSDAPGAQATPAARG